MEQYQIIRTFWTKCNNWDMKANNGKREKVTKETNKNNKIPIAYCLLYTYVAKSFVCFDLL